MHLSKKAEYALRAMVALARHPHAPPLLIEEISDAGRIPVKFLEQILLALKHADLVRSKRGVGGGYQINRPPTAISVGDIVKVIDGPFDPIACTTADPERNARHTCECGQLGGCGLGRVFTELQRQVNAFLNNTSIADVVAKEQRAGEISFEI